MRLLLFVCLLFPILSFSQVVRDIEVEGVTVKIELGQYKGKTHYDVKLGVSSCENITFRFYNKREEITHSYTFSKRVSVNFSIDDKRKLKGWFLEVELKDGSVLVYDVYKEKIVK
jgi:hypothetical protein